MNLNWCQNVKDFQKPTLKMGGGGVKLYPSVINQLDLQHHNDHHIETHLDTETQQTARGVDQGHHNVRLIMYFSKYCAVLISLLAVLLP